MLFRQGVVLYRAGKTAYRSAFRVGENLEAYGLIITSSLKKKGKGTVISVDIEATEEVIIEEVYLEGARIFSPESRIFCNGYQSWTDSRGFAPREKFYSLRWPLSQLGLKYYGDYFFKDYPESPGLFHGYTYGYVREDQNFLFIGSLSEREGYTIIQADTEHNLLRVYRDWNNLKLAGKRNAFSLFVCEAEERHVFENYFKLQNLKTAIPPVCTGWTSWYNYYTDISEKIILDNLRIFEEEKIPIDVFQIDDGYQKAVGDWLKIKKEFPHGMGHIADSIRDRGFRAGLWLAPFVAEKKSDIFLNHKDWFLKDERGRHVKAGFNPGWSYSFYALDIYNEEVRGYLKEVFDTVLKDWGYDMVKLDFLYAAALAPPEGKSRGEVMSDAMILLRNLVGKKEILGCGVPLGPSFGLVDYCRIGSDVALRWEDPLLSWGNYRERVSTVNSLTSTVGRRNLNGRAFLNDPDVFLLRSDNCKLSESEKYTLFVLNNVLGGLLFTSDNIKNYTPEEMSLFRSMFPFREKEVNFISEEDGSIAIDFSIGDNRYLVFSNLSENPKMMFLPEGLYFTSGGSEDNFIRGEIHLTVEARTTVCLLKVKAGNMPLRDQRGISFPGAKFLPLR